VTEAHSNDLGPAEIERLALLSEECGEVVRVVGKILRHGYESCNPFDPAQTTNRVLLARELGDLEAAITRCIRGSDIPTSEFYQAREAKLHDNRFLHHQD
jgi:hypothetical protein